MGGVLIGLGLAAFLVAAAVFLGFQWPLIRELGPRCIFDTVIGYRPDVVQRLHAYLVEPANAAKYRRELQWDNRFAVAYTVMLLCFLIVGAQAWSDRDLPGSDLIVGLAILLPIVAGGCDLVENRLFGRMLTFAPGALPPPLIRRATLITNCKWIALAGAVLLLVGAFAATFSLVPG